MGNKLNRTKLDEIRQGPFPITKIIGKHIMEVKINEGSKGYRKYHVSKIIPKNCMLEAGLSRDMDVSKICGCSHLV